MPTPRRGNLDLEDEERGNGSADFGQESDDVDVVNLEDVDENVQFEVIPPGIYRAQVENVEYTRSKASNNPMLTWQFRVFIPQEDGADDRERVLFYYTPLTEKGYPRLKRALMRIAPDTNMKEFRPREAAYDLVGKECRLNIRVELDRQDRTQKRNAIKDVLEPEEDVASQYFRD